MNKRKRKKRDKAELRKLINGCAYGHHIVKSSVEIMVREIYKLNQEFDELLHNYPIIETIPFFGVFARPKPIISIDLSKMRKIYSSAASDKSPEIKN